MRRAYRRLAWTHHPDRNPGPGAEHRFREINEAYRALTHAGSLPDAPLHEAPRSDSPAPDAPAPDQQPDQQVAEPVHRPAPGSNRLAAASLFTAVAAVCLPSLCTAPLGLFGAALGHAARWQIRRTGEAGGGLALAGVVVGWAAVVVTLGATAVGVLISRG